MSWACDAYNCTVTVANPGNSSSHKMFYGEIPQTSPIHFLKPGYCKYKCTSRMNPKARECYYLGPTRNPPRESKHVFVHTEKVIITRNVTWARVRSRRSSTAQSKPSMKGGYNESRQDQKASAADSGSVSEDGEPESGGTASEIETAEAEAAAPITSGRAPSSTSCTGSIKCEVSLDPESYDVIPLGLANASAAASTSYGPDKQYATSSAQVR